MALKYNPLVFIGLDDTGTAGGGGTVTSVGGGVGWTPTPDPIVGAGVGNLDIDDLVTNLSLAPLDLFPYVDVSAGGTAIANQRKVTFEEVYRAAFEQFSAVDLGPADGAGFVRQDGAGGWNARTFIEGANIDITNPTGAGNPVFSVAPQGTGSGLDADLLDGLDSTAFQPIDADLTAYAALATTGIVVRTGAGTVTTRSIAVTDTATVNLTITNADGVAGNPTLQADVLASAIDHGSLSGLADDDHSIYLLLAGRAGTANNAVLSTTQAGRIVGSSAAFGLELQGSTATTAIRSIVLHPTAVNVGGAVRPLLEHTAALVFDNAGDVLDGLAIGTSGGAPVTWSFTTNPVGGEGLLLFAPIMQNSPSGTSRTFGSWVGVSCVPTLSQVGAGLSGMSSWQAVHDSVIFGTNTVVTNYTTVESFPSGGGGTLGLIGTYRGLHVMPAVGTITTGVGVDINDFTATTALSLRSAGAAVQMRHLGPAVFGANAAPTNTSSVGLEVQSTTLSLLLSRMTSAQRNALTAVDGMLLYNSTTPAANVREESAWKTLVVGEGRTGGQTIIGQTAAATGGLTLQGGSNASVFSSIFLATQTNLGALTTAVLDYKTAITMGAGGYLSGLLVGADEAFNSVTWSATGNLFGVELFSFRATFVNSPSGTGRDFGTIGGLFTGQVYSHAGAGASTVTESYGAWHNPSIGANVTVALDTSFKADGVYTGTCTLRRGLHVLTTGGTVTTGVGVDIDDFTATTGISLRSVGTGKSMRHAGPALFGTTGAPNTTKGVDIDGDLSTRQAGLVLANGANNDIAIGNRSFVRITGPTAAFNITSIASPFDGKRIVLYNTTTQNMTLTQAAATGTAANRIIATEAVDPVTVGAGIAELIYSAADSRWVILSIRG